jgi:hypothetical protein
LVHPLIETYSFGLRQEEETFTTEEADVEEVDEVPDIPPADVSEEE